MNKVAFFVSTVGALSFGVLQLACSAHVAIDKQIVEDKCNSELMARAKLYLNLNDYTLRNCWTRDDRIGGVLTNSSEPTTPPIALDLSKSTRDLHAIILIVGGPGNDPIAALDYTDEEPTLVEMLRNSDQNIVAPVYSGTRNRSNYPGSSFKLAVSEIRAFAVHLRSDAKFTVMAHSLGARLLGIAGETCSPLSLHKTVLLSPLSRNTADILAESSRQDRSTSKYALERNRWMKFIVRGEERELRWYDFLDSFYGQSSEVDRDIFHNLRNSCNDDYSNWTAVLGEKDYSAGDADSYAPKYNSLGIKTVILPGADHYLDEIEYNRVVDIITKSRD